MPDDPKEYPWPAPEGQVWVCGKSGKERANFGDESCMLNAILCHEKKGDDGIWRAVEMPEDQ